MRVELSRRALKDVRKVPIQIARALQEWVAAVKLVGLREVRKSPGYHDEPLKGARKGQRSIRLSRSYRAIYEIRRDHTVEFVCVKEVTKHDY